MKTVYKSGMMIITCWLTDSIPIPCQGIGFPSAFSLHLLTAVNHCHQLHRQMLNPSCSFSGFPCGLVSPFMAKVLVLRIGSYFLPKVSPSLRIHSLIKGLPILGETSSQFVPFQSEPLTLHG